MPAITTELSYLALILALLVVPRALQRFLLPAPLSCFGFGLLAALVLSGFGRDGTLALLASLGISSLFLFAGLEIDLAALRRGVGPLLAHLAVRALTLAGFTVAAIYVFDLPWNAACLLALVVLFVVLPSLALSRSFDLDVTELGVPPLGPPIGVASASLKR